MNEIFEMQTLIIDVGSCTIRSGFAGDDEPKVTLPTIVGRPKYYGGCMLGMDHKDAYVGDEAKSKRGVLRLKYPMEYRLVTNWDDMEKIWHHTFYNELRVAPEEHALVLTEPVLNPRTHRERITQILVETFWVPCFCLYNSAVLALYSADKTTGVVLDSGLDVTQIVPIFESCIITYAIIERKFGGRDVLNLLIEMLSERNIFPHPNFAESEIIEDIKVKLCYVKARDDMIHSENDVSYVLPDGKEIILGAELSRAPEILFSPQENIQNQETVHSMLVSSIAKCDLDIHQEMYSNILVCGGNTLFKGFSERLYNEIKHLCPDGVDLKIHSPEDRKFLSWVGASKLASINTFSDLLIQKSMIYLVQLIFTNTKEEIGAVIIETGSFTTNAGIAGYETPKAKFPTVVGRRKIFPLFSMGQDEPDAWVGDDAISRRGFMYLKNPISHGLVTNWDDLEKVWHHTFYNELRIAPEEHSVILIEPILNTIKQRERMTQIMFETFNVKSLWIKNSAYLALLALGKETGVVLDSGLDMTSVVPIFEGYIIYYGIMESYSAGKKVSYCLLEMLKEQENSTITSTQKHFIVEDIKKTHCQVNLREMTNNQIKTTTYQLPGGTRFLLNDELTKPLEILFNPALFGEKEEAIQNLVVSAISKCDLDIYEELYSSIVICGGNTMFKGFSERLLNEIKLLCPQEIKPKVYSSEERGIQSWKGASVLCSLDIFFNLVMTREEYWKKGPSYIHRVCLNL
eukprot:maker-scaffold_13-snap-gene-3.58-mRNA-1 protein AED:0.01 eAED:0.03 QI:0/0/0/1/0/0/3/0/742